MSRERGTHVGTFLSVLAVLALSCVLLPAEPVQADLSADLVAFYLFNTNANDESGNGNNGFVRLGATLTADRFGNPNSAFSFVGPSNPPISGTGGIQVPDNGSSLDITGDFSIALWLRATGTDGWVLNKHATNINGDGSWSLPLSDGRLAFGATPHFDSSIASGQIPNGAWAFVVLTYSRTTGLWTFYINGAPDTSGTAALTIADTSQPLLIGIHADNFLPFPGDLDDIRIYKRVLTGGEIATLFADSPAIVVVDITAGSVIRLDPTSGAQNVISSGGLLVNPRGVAVAGDGTIYISDFTAHGIVKVDAATGVQTLVTSL